ncbi:hypothetical protein K470DRAFT_255618 [Piedraia hortae CBS 480.64]|uniref:Uncharacterized protein n=1 Tax=Piedraia hortae CBS 480.64 TaxID=1314780 RepID=A0A6A7C607_9PEZI|nr:hypothetical protein K470DRAFT_255618 [Piedraia hortae CBS 480.64]
MAQPHHGSKSSPSQLRIHPREGLLVVASICEVEARGCGAVAVDEEDGVAVQCEVGPELLIYQYWRPSSRGSCGHSCHNQLISNKDRRNRSGTQCLRLRRSGHNQLTREMGNSCATNVKPTAV